MEDVAGSAAVLVDPLDAQSIAAGIDAAIAPARRARPARARTGQALHVGPGRGRCRRRLRAGGSMSAPLVVVDADVLGRRRTGDETYVRNLLRELAPLAGPAGLRLAAVTRRPDSCPRGSRRSSCPAAAAGGEDGLDAAAPAAPRRAPRSSTRSTRCRSAAPCPAVVTIHDLSFERDPDADEPRRPAVFRRDRAAGGAGRPSASSRSRSAPGATSPSSTASRRRRSS